MKSETLLIFIPILLKKYMTVILEEDKIKMNMEKIYGRKKLFYKRSHQTKIYQ